MRTSTLFTVLATTATLSQAIYPPTIDGLTLAWSDTFDGAAGGRPNSEAWNLVTNTNTNNEVQTYTESSQNIQLSGGSTLQLVPFKDQNGAWTSGRIETRGSFTPQPGKVMRWQAGIRMGSAANKKGMWPAFWMLGDAMRTGTQWPLCGEIDIFEQLNGDMTGHGTIHCGTEKGGVCNEPLGRGATVPIPDNEFHNWGLVIDRSSNNWQTEVIQWQLNGVPFQTITGAQLGDEGTWATLAHSPLYVLLNVAVGGNWPVSSFLLLKNLIIVHKY